MLQAVEEFQTPSRGRGRPPGLVYPGKVLGRPRNDRDVIPIKTTLVFALNKTCESQVIINRGGARSSKSYSIAQWIIEISFTIPKVKILILRKTSPSLRVSCKPLIYEILDAYNLRSRIIEVKSDQNMFSPVKGMIHFSGLDDPVKIRSSDWNVIFMEEANEFDYADFVTLKLRLSAPTYKDFRNRILLSFNPVDEQSWLKIKVVNNQSEDLTEIVSNYQMNPFLSEDYRRTIEALKWQDANYYRIFALGEWGKLENLIYSNWKAVEEIPEGDEIWGLDFGFNNPTSLVRCLVDSFQAGVEQKLYKSGLTNSDLIVEMNRIMTPEQKANSPIYADCAEPARIQELCNEGFWVFPADKSVKDGIDFTKRHKLLIKNDSDDILKEIKGYSYKTDRDGKVQEEPVKFADHTMDAIRYCLYTHNKRHANAPGIRVLDWNNDRSRNEWDDDDD